MTTPTSRDGLTQSAPIRGLRILIVEDEPLVAMLIEDMLENLGIIVAGVARTLSQGLAMAGDETLEFDGAVLDVNLGGEQVFPIAERLAARDAPFIFATAYGPAGIIKSFAHRPTLTKPYGPTALATTLTAAVRRAA
jgi:CheY-like chemotaxis protein